MAPNCTEFLTFGTGTVHWNLHILGEMQQSGDNCGEKCLLMGGCRM
jgi:hypothetical protein